jgi:ClpP class serine protease
MLYYHNILNGVWMMDEGYAANYIPLLASYLKGDKMLIEKPQTKIIDSVYSFNGDVMSSMPLNAGMDNNDTPVNCIAVINISGVITKQDQFCGPAGMKSKAELLCQCFDNDNISAVILVIESGGGEGMAMRLMDEALSKKNKPCGAFIDDLACSAAYGIASCCDIIYANNNLAQVGSIGTYITISDCTERLKQMGVNLVEVYASASTDKNKDAKDAIAGNDKAIKAKADVYNDYFLQMIERNRGEKLTSGKDVWGTGKVYFAEVALSLGLIDGIDTLENFINIFNI